MLLTVSAVVTAESVNIVNCNSKTREIGGESAFQFKVNLFSVEQLDTLVANLEKLQDVVRVVRGDMDDMLHDSPAAFWELARDPDPDA